MRLSGTEKQHKGLSVENSIDCGGRDVERPGNAAYVIPTLKIIKNLVTLTERFEPCMRAWARKYPTEVSMPLSPKYQSENVSDQGDIELGVRRALGLDAAGPGSVRSSQAPRSASPFNADRAKRGFGQDGKVDVVIVHGRRTNGQHGSDPHWAGGPSAINRVETAEAALKAEREARERSERGLAEAESTIRELHTKLGHTTLAIDEARDAARQSQAGMLSAEAALTAERDARESVEKALEEAYLSRAATEQRLHQISAAKRLTSVVPDNHSTDMTGHASASRQSTVVSRKTSAISTEPKPVRWWIKPKKA